MTIKKLSSTQVRPDTDFIADREKERLIPKSEDQNSGGIPKILVTEVLPGADQKEGDHLFKALKFKEICGILDKGNFRVVGRDDLE